MYDTCMSVLLLEIDLLTLSMCVGLKLPPFTNPICGQMGRSCPDMDDMDFLLVFILIL